MQLSLCAPEYSPVPPEVLVELGRRGGDYSEQSHPTMRHPNFPDRRLLEISTSHRGKASEDCM